MSAVELTEQFLAKIAGWDVVKQARSLLERGQVLSSSWAPPILKGVVREGTISYRAGLAIKDAIDLENMCSCRASRQWGTICVHSVAVGLHHLRRAAIAQRSSAPQAGPPGRPIPALAAAKAPAPKRVCRAKPGERGEPAELHIYFPPNLSEAAARDKVMLCLEAKWRRGRMPLNALPMEVPFEFSEVDQLVLDELERLAGGETPAMVQLKGEQVSGLLERLVGHPRLTQGRANMLAVIRTPWVATLTATLTHSGEIRLALTEKPPILKSAGKGWVISNGIIQPFEFPAGYLDLWAGPMILPRSRVPQFLSQDWARLQGAVQAQANFTLNDFVFEPQPPKFLLHLTGGLAQLQAQLQCAYGPRIMTVGVTAAGEASWLPDPESPTRYSTRDLASEQTAQARLARSGFTGPDAQGRYQLAGQTAVLNFFAREYPRLQKEWQVTLEERLEKSADKNIERVEPRFEITPSGEQWFDLSVSFSTPGGERFSQADIQRLLLSGQSHTRLRNGKFALIDTGAVEELQDVLLDCNPRQHESGYRLATAQAGFLEATLRQKPQWQVAAPLAWRERAARQSGEAKIEPPPLGDLEPVLRPYQKSGVGWLHFLRLNQFGGILADEMGLGKTLQALAHLQALKASQDPAQHRPSLVVCPTSLVFNWLEEARKFTPGLRVLGVHGPRRHERFSDIAQADLVVTSYALIRRDAEQYRPVEFDTVILDEAQHIKNRQTQNAQAVKAIRAAHRLVLTGTPLENSVLDLWSIFDFLMPGYLGSARDFRERYEQPIARDQDPNTQKRLARRLRPFLLRRLKQDVAADLPEKIEQVAYCELTSDQRALYDQVLEAGRNEVVRAVDQQGLQKSRMIILNALLRLRQICCDLRLLNLEKINPESASGKVDLFAELLEEVIDGGHRVLVFSQFVSMLSLLREKLAAEQVDYCYLDGATTDRATVVQQFQNNLNIPVFLISLKAGGVGLNLTGADTVIHFDPWWNPAVEEQATDRSHRIGQTRVVTSYKLIARGTVEEKILNLQQRKRELTRHVLAGEEVVANELTWEEIRDLFE